MRGAPKFFAHAQNDTGWPIRLSSSVELMAQDVGINGLADLGEEQGTWFIEKSSECGGSYGDPDAE